MAAGKPIADVAREKGISRSWASREANAPETRLMIERMLDARAERFDGLVDKALDVIEGGLGAKGARGRPDHKVRLLATKRVIEMALAGRRYLDEQTGPSTVTYQQFLTIYEQRRAAA